MGELCMYEDAESINIDIVELDTDTAEQYRGYITPEAAENIGRTYFRGLIAADDDEAPLAGIVWEVRHIDTDEDNEANIIWLKIDHDDAASLLFDKYNELLAEDEVVTSTYSLSARGMIREKAALKDQGFTVGLMEGDLIKTRLSEIERLPFMNNAKMDENIQPLANMTQRGFNAGIKQFVMLGFHGVYEDLSELPRLYFENEVSCFSQSDGKANGMLLFHLVPSGALRVVIMAAIGSDYGKVLTRLMRYALKNALENYEPETEVWIDRHNYPTLALSEKLFPRSFGVAVYMGSRKENQ